MIICMLIWAADCGADERKALLLSEIAGAADQD